MSHHELPRLLVPCVVIAVMFFTAYLEFGWDRYRSITCMMCGARDGEKHAPECPWQR